MMERITSDPEICGGKPCIRGTRMTVRAVLEYMAGGDSVEDMLRYYPDLEREDILACIGFAAERSDAAVFHLAAE